VCQASVFDASLSPTGTTEGRPQAKKGVTPTLMAVYDFVACRGDLSQLPAFVSTIPLQEPTSTRRHQSLAAPSPLDPSSAPTETRTRAMEPLCTASGQPRPASQRPTRQQEQSISSAPPGLGLRLELFSRIRWELEYIFACVCVRARVCDFQRPCSAPSAILVNTLGTGGVRSADVTSAAPLQLRSCSCLRVCGCTGRGHRQMQRA
jgi:hypothetical protein